jgi:hypothetical protein
MAQGQSVVDITSVEVHGDILVVWENLLLSEGVEEVVTSPLPWGHTPPLGGMCHNRLPDLAAVVLVVIIMVVLRVMEDMPSQWLHLLLHLPRK